MKISFNWLKEYIKIEESPEKICEYLTDCGLEVEGMEKTDSVKGGLAGLVIGEVVRCEKHPDADRLSVTEVNIGTEILPIVCGAPNVAQGQKVVVATVGTTLYPSEGGEFQIKKAKIRGQQSQGMICAEDEIGLGENHEGIMVLDPSAETGTPASVYFDIQTDYTIEIGLTPNRIDAASHMGVARDLVAVFNHLYPDKESHLIKPDVSHFLVDENTCPVKITIEDTEACPRYTGLCISGVKIAESPEWIKNRLKTIGLKPINNLVDITNYVLHETGQPLHAFDADKIEGNQVIIQKPSKGTTFITLDEEEIKLSGNDLMICNAREPMCIAGVLGGVASGVTEQTQNIFLESAYFDPAHIRRSSKQHSINTDASFRFERGADPEITIFALKRAAMLIKEIAGGKITSQVMDVYPKPRKPSEVKFYYLTADKLIGKTIERETIKNILRSLEIKIKEESEKHLLLEIPPYRVDVTREADVVEEILRIYGYNKVELPERLHASIVATPKPNKNKLQNISSELLSSRGFNEIMNNSLSRAAYYSEDQNLVEDSVVKILNPLSQDLSVMRQTLFFGGLETILWNQNRKITNLKIYEFGNIYFKEKSGDYGTKTPLPGYRENMRLDLFMCGDIKPESWYEKNKPVDFFDLKAEIINLLDRINIPVKELKTEEMQPNGFFETGLTYFYNKQIFFEVGLVSGKYLKMFDLKQPVFYGSVNWDFALKLSNKNQIIFREITKFPEVRRDLALLINNNVKFADIERIARQAERKILKEVTLFDIYKDTKIGENMKSYAVSFTLLDEKKTLTDKEIDKSMDKISKSLQRELNASLR